MSDNTTMGRIVVTAPLTREDLDAVGIVDRPDHTLLHLHPDCHPNAGMGAHYCRECGTVTLWCGECGADTLRLAIGIARRH